MNNPALSLRFGLRVLAKALVLFVIFNLLFAWLNPLPTLGRLSVYNRLVPGRVRLPYGEHPERAYNLSLFNLEAMFASHELVASKPADEFRVVLIGDSSTWGFLLPPQENLAAQINRLDLRVQDGRRLRAYNLGYPVMSLTKDVLLLSRAQAYAPDLIVWPVTLESFPYDKQLFPPLLQNNAPAVRDLIARHHLKLDPQAAAFLDRSFLERTLVGQRRALADWIRFQFYGILWAATGIDQDLPQDFEPPQNDLSAELSFHDLQPPDLRETDLALDVLQAGVKEAAGTPVLLVNEPMFVSSGENSSLRYNFFYPRWAYDDYRTLLRAWAEREGVAYLDLWNLLPPAEFTNSAVHRSPTGEAAFAQALSQAMLKAAQGHP